MPLPHISQLRSALLSIAQSSVLCASLALHASSGMAAPHFNGVQEIPLWGANPAPGTRGVKLIERWDSNTGSSGEPERDVSNISTPSLTVFMPKVPNGSAMIVVPGGGYRKNVFDKEGVHVARWLTSIGVTAFVLKYRLPPEWPTGGRQMPLQDGQRAIRLVRSHAADWGINPDRIGVIGFSSGGNLAANMATRASEKTYEPLDAEDQVSAKLNAAVLVYASIDTRLPWGDAPSTFIIAADDDRTVDSENSVGLYTALHRAGVSAELHLFRDGGHGFAVRESTSTPIAQWPKLCLAWMQVSGFVPR